MIFGTQLNDKQRRELAGIGATMFLAKTAGSVDAINPEVLFCGTGNDDMVKVHVAPRGDNSVRISFEDDEYLDFNDVNFQVHNSLFEAVVKGDGNFVDSAVAQYFDMLDHGRESVCMHRSPLCVCVCVFFLGGTRSLAVLRAGVAAGCENQVHGQLVRCGHPNGEAAGVLEVHETENPTRYVEVLPESDAGHSHFCGRATW